jgi:5'-deoxynucleotidase YfbR-like HD superfamily hydrolase
MRGAGPHEPLAVLTVRRPQPERAWQRMLSGRRLDLLDPSPLDIEIADIAHGLARVARWNGQTSGPHIFSVAQHSVVVERIAVAQDPRLTPAERLVILLHDAAEYVIGDMISPFKAVLGEAYKGVENRILAAVLVRFTLPPLSEPLRRQTKQADRAATFLEAVRLAGFARAEAEKLFGRPAADLESFEPLLRPASVDEAEQRFLERFHVLEAARMITPA